MDYQIIEWIKDILSPPQCLYCRVPLINRDIFCAECFAKIAPITSYQLSLTSTKKLTVFAVGAYQDPLRRLILYKRKNMIIGAQVLAQLIWERTVFEDLACDVIIPIPLHWARLFWRGFNQAEEMARYLARQKGCGCISLLERSRRTSYQAEVPVKERERNIRGAFKLSISAREFELYSNKHLVLVDDLMTTGSTLKFAARELFQLKPASISAIVVCRAC